jgi:hypothetical protein
MVLRVPHTSFLRVGPCRGPHPLVLSLRRVGFKGADFDLSLSMSSSIFPYCKWWFSKPLGAMFFRVHGSCFAVSVAQVGRVFCGRPEAFRCFSQGRFYVCLSLPVFVGAGFRPAILPFRVPQPSFLRVGPHRVLAPRTNNETAVIPRKFARMPSCGQTTRGPQRALRLRPLGWGEGSAFSWFPG